MKDTSLDIRPLAGNIGAEVRGVDLARDLDAATFAAIREAFHRHLVLAFPDQSLAPERQAAFVARFGRVMTDPFIKPPEDRPELMVVRKERGERHAFGEGWHSDNTYLERPPLASFLYAVEVPAVGGDTVFSNQYLAYETLSPGLRATLDGLRAIHEARAYATIIEQGAMAGIRSMPLRNDAVMAEALRMRSSHPVARTHPATGRKALYVNAAYTIRFDGWTEAESLPLLEFLYDHAVRPAFTCRVRWAAGTLVFWDNRCVQHSAVNDYHGQRRVMHRITAEGERPA
jgi:taurine dioxygenase